MIKKIFNKVVSALLPNESQEEQTSFYYKKGIVAPRQRVLNKLKEHFLSEMANETTTESLLYHTSFKVYIKETEYDRLSPSFAQTVRDAINIFVMELRKEVKKYPDYQNHSRYWEMQLVSIPKDAVIDGISAELVAESTIIIRSKLFADNPYDPRMQQSGGRFVTTIHTKDSSKQLSNAINLEALTGLTELAKDKYRVEFRLDEVKEALKSEADKPLNSRSANDKPNSKNKIVATLHIVDGEFISGGFTYHAYKMTGDKLLVSGKNGEASTSGTPELHINDDSLLTPTLEIVRDAKTGLFSMKVWGDVKMGGKRIESGAVVRLPHNSSIMINDDYQIDFTTR